MEEQDMLNLKIAKEAIEEYLRLADDIKEILCKNDGKTWARKIPQELQSLSPYLVVYTDTNRNYDGTRRKCIHIKFNTREYLRKNFSYTSYIPYEPSLIYFCRSEDKWEPGGDFLKEHKYIRADVMNEEIDRQTEYWQKTLIAITVEVNNPDSVTAIVQEYIDTLHHAEEIWKTLSTASQVIFGNGHGTNLFNFPYLHK